MKALVLINLVLTALLLAGFTAFAVLVLQGRVDVGGRLAVHAAWTTVWDLAQNVCYKIIC